jgi:predicted nucleic acid-binding protein
MVVVSDASPLIILSEVGLFRLLHDLFHEIHITKAIYAEVVTHGEHLPGSAELQQARDTWIHVHPMPSRRSLRTYHGPRGLSLADASVITLARTLKAGLVLIDEKALRRAATATGLAVVGVGGILFHAKRTGLIPNVRDPLEQALAHGLRLSAPLKEHLLRITDELEE